MSTKKYQLNFLFICDHAFVGEDGKLNVIGIFKEIKLADIPGVHLKSVLVGNFSILDKKTKELNIQVDLLRPDNRPVGLAILPNKLPIAQETKEPKDVNFTLEFGNLKFETEGEHKFEVKANGEFLGEYKFQVKKA